MAVNKTTVHEDGDGFYFTIPDKIVRDLKLADGDEFRIYAVNGSVMLSRTEED